MANEKRARQKANRAAKRAREAEEAKQEERVKKTRRISRYLAIGAGIFVLLLLINMCRAQDNTIDLSDSSLSGETNVSKLLDAVPSDFEAFSGNKALANVAPSARIGAYSQPPAETVSAEVSYSATIETSKGTIELELFNAEAPAAVTSFINLAKDGYYDGTKFVGNQGVRMLSGDPTGNGSGTPGYELAVETNDAYSFSTPGLVALDAGSKEGHVDGGRFFFNGGSDTTLDGNYSIFGRSVGDSAVLSAISQNPAAVTINSITITEN